jgi:CheY-like chemotaxis protein
MQPRAEKSVLIVEDDDILRSAMKMVLEWEGYRAVCATNGQEALELLQQTTPPGLILLDLMMPVVDGWQLCRELKDNPDLASIPLVVVSALTAAESPQAVAHIQKPFQVQEVLDVIRGLPAVSG